MAMRHKVWLATGCLHISAVVYLLVAVALFPLMLAAGQDELLALWTAVFGGGLGLALVVGIEIVAHGLRRRKFWAWIAGLCIFGLYVPSAFFPLGALGLWGLLDDGSRAEFGIDTRSMPPDRKRFSSPD